jgi:small subunit ribosomal protein S20
MPIIKSAKKRVKVSSKATVRNAKTKRIVRETLKDLKKALAGGKSKEIEESQKKAYSAIDTAQKKNVLHKNKASRKKSQISKAVKSATITQQPSAKKVSEPKPAKAVAKKAPAKKTVAKKESK